MYVAAEVLDSKAWVRIPGRSSKMKYEKIFIRQLPPSRLLAKILRVKQTCLEKVSQKSVARSLRKTVCPTTHV